MAIDAGIRTKAAAVAIGLLPAGEDVAPRWLDKGAGVTLTLALTPEPGSSLSSGLAKTVEIVDDVRC